MAEIDEDRRDCTEATSSQLLLLSCPAERFPEIVSEKEIQRVVNSYGNSTTRRARSTSPASSTDPLGRLRTQRPFAAGGPLTFAAHRPRFASAG